MRKIELTQGQFALVSDEDFERVNQFKWHAAWRKGTRSFYACRCLQEGRAKGSKQQRIYLQRFIMELEVEKYDTERVGGHAAVVDHINRDTLDNRQENLRITNARGNWENVPKFSGNRGVVWDSRAGMWGAFMYKGKQYADLGLFELKEDAIRRRSIAKVDWRNEQKLLKSVITT